MPFLALYILEYKSRWLNVRSGEREDCSRFPQDLCKIVGIKSLEGRNESHSDEELWWNGDYASQSHLGTVSGTFLNRKR
jgi:hypothetical protein